MVEWFIKGGLVMWPLLICSLLSVAVCLDRAYSLLEWKKRKKDHFIWQARLILEKDPAAFQKVEVRAQEAVDRIKKGLHILDTIITMAPLLGILGTVIGIIDSFQLLGEAGIEAPQAVLGGIAKALITTATGLTISIATLVPYNFFTGQVNRIAADLNRTLVQMKPAPHPEPVRGRL